MAVMARLNTCTAAAICTRGLRWEVPRAPSSLPVRHLPLVKTGLLQSKGLSKSRKPLAGSCRPPLRTADLCSNHQLVARAAAADDRPPQSYPSIDRRDTDEQSHSSTEENHLPSSEELLQHTVEQAEPLGIGEDNSLPSSPAGSRQYDEQDPRKQLAKSKEEGVIVRDAHLMPLPADSVIDFESNQADGWSESSCDQGSIFHVNSPAPSVDVVDISTPKGSTTESLLIDRLLQSLPLYDRGRSAEDYRIRALIYGRIGEYFSKGEGKARGYEVEDKKQNVLDVRMLTAMQQLADFILAEEGRSAADYNCRAQFFKNSAEIFCKGREDSVTGSDEEKAERVLQSLEDMMLSDSGRSISDYSRRANVFEKTADALSHKKDGAATVG